MQRLDQPLSDKELNVLAEFLGVCCDKDRGMPLTMADGYMTALVSGPTFFPPSKWLREIFNLDTFPKISTGADLNLNDSTSLVLRRYNQIIRGLEERCPDLLLGRSDDPSVASDLYFGELWCSGYLRGMGLDSQGWKPLFSDEQAPSGFDDIFFLAVPGIAKDAKGEIKPEFAESYAEFKALTLEERSEIAKNLTDPVYEVYEYWRDARRRNAMSEQARSTKVGRNEPCPCGSGKKSKRCCAA